MARRGRCRCGAVLSFRKGPNGYKMRCPSCGSVVRLTTAARSRARPTAMRAPAGGRTVTCEACHTLVSAEASRCPGCGSILALTTAAPALESELASLGVMAPKLSSDRRLVGWLVACIAVMLVTLAVLIVSLRH